MKATQALFRRARRLQLTTKQVNKGYYKGTGSGSMGTHTKHGRYMLDPWKIRTYIVPLSLEQFHLTPFVSKNVKPTRGNFKGWADGPLSGEAYLKKWKEHGSGE